MVKVRSGQDAPARTLVAFLTHTAHPSAFGRMKRLRRQLPVDHDFVVLCDVSGEDESGSGHPLQSSPRLVPFTSEAVTDTPYPLKGRSGRLVPGNLDLLYLWLHRLNPGYDHYWFVEYDVAYTGGWDELFGRFAEVDADLLGTTLTPYAHRPEWYHWDSFRPSDEIPREAWHRGFFPLIRLSRRSMGVLDAAYRDGWGGHAEATVPTALLHAGLSVRDIGGDGPYVHAGDRNRFYTNTPTREGLYPGTFVYRPARRWPGLRRRKLWHPVKPGHGRLTPFVAMSREWLKYLTSVR